MTETPRTAAGRTLVEDEPLLVTGEHSMLRRVLAIEAEAAQDAARQRDELRRVRKEIKAAIRSIQIEIDAAAPEGRDLFEDGALAAYQFALSVMPILRATEGKQR